MEAEVLPVEDPLAPPQPPKKRRKLSPRQYKELVRLGGILLVSLTQLGMELYGIFMAIGFLVK